jgi:ubiquitin carboxyl-terminal hydrolase 7
VDYMSLYLEQAYEEGQVLENWYACVQFALVLWSPSKPSKYVSHGRAFQLSMTGLFWLMQS